MAYNFNDHNYQHDIKIWEKQCRPLSRLRVILPTTAMNAIYYGHAQGMAIIYLYIYLFMEVTSSRQQPSPVYKVPATVSGRLEVCP